MPFSAIELSDLPDVISAPRFATYLRAAGNNRSDALALYQWNLEVSAAFIVPLQVCEVAVRNGVVEALEKVHGANWPWSNGFIRSLPIPKKTWHYNPQTDLQTVASRMPTAGKVVAELKFAFWEKTFTAGQDLRLWVPHMQSAFPGVPAGTPIPMARANAFAALQAVRALRNRIAHHEPIFTRDIQAEYQRLHDMIHWRNPTAASWMDRIQKVTTLIPLRP
ncbi:hypothetical protein [Rhizobium oryziradicis]|uniref:Abi-like protein n=1 Tax=Rhizobium oryziradicis TaxID=1867956 RepID=A0A1Q8ZQU6_9HYPH|nr:hypothetical protein [Rhizobium oryziradicis]OLP44427.1 hypothetical protein BJF95_07810 [Rhizobium oryziradicis]